MPRRYTKFQHFSIETFREYCEAEREHTISEICSQFNVTRRQIYYLVSKHHIRLEIKRDVSQYKTQAFREAISRGNKGKIRSEEQKQRYRDACKKRIVGNNRPKGTYVTSEKTRIKQQISNLRTYANLPQNWINSCIANELWYEKLRQANRPHKTQEHLRKIIETKVGMKYEDWILLQSEYDRYRYEVLRITNSQKLELLANYSLRGISHHLDHKFSIAEGFRNHVPAEIIGDITNLAIIPAVENLRKNKKCSCSLDELFCEYEKRNNAR